MSYNSRRNLGGEFAAADGGNFVRGDETFHIDELVWAYNEESRKWRRAKIIALVRPRELAPLDAGAKDEAYIHWKGYDRRLDSWVSWDNVKKFSLENLTKGYDPADIDSDGHGDVDKFYIKQHQANTKFRTISFVRLGQYEISTWYFSPYPREVQNIKTLLLCEFCLSFFKHEVEYERHASRCVSRHPPGNEIYRNETNSVWEVDGGICKIYCENLCFLSKLFLDHKTLKHCVSLFMFYILTDICEDGFRIVGYFSKEKYSRNNLSCILVLPHCQRRGFGKFLISFSYALTLMQEIRGTPERPLSDLGRVSYYNFWKQCILHVLKDESEFTINELANELGFEARDIIDALKADNLLLKDPSLNKVFLYLPSQYLERIKKVLGEPCPVFKAEDIHWVPYDAFMAATEYKIV